MTPFPAELSLRPVGRHPLRLPDLTVRAFCNTRLPILRVPAQRPRSSIVIVTYNQLVYTKACLATLLANTPVVPEYELIVVDNGSSDGTVEYLENLQEPRVRVVRNSCNRGFAAAVNQGVTQARGEVVVLLNNDTLVASGWLDGLIRHLAEPTVGLVGPVTNSAPNESQIEIPYETYGGFEEFAARRVRDYAGHTSEISMLTMFCVALWHATYVRLGPLDERFSIGTFEDDDYSRRALGAGLRLVCAEDVFVHHFGQASFGELVPNGSYSALLARNRRLFEEKWHTTWQPHRHRPSREYDSLVERIRFVTSAVVPGTATILVASRGDDALLDLGDNRRGWHFPQLPNRRYAGYYPTDSDAAIDHLETLRGAGADHLMFPAPSLWWLDHYVKLREHLDDQYRRLVTDDGTCWIYQLERKRPA